jgi:hypothetical protein
MQIPVLKKVGTCCICKQRVEIEPRSFCDAPQAHDFQGKNCKGAGYTASDTALVIEKPEEAVAVANFIKADDGRSCFGTFGHMGHTLACGDGEYCNAIRHFLARALAEYYLKTIKEKEEIQKVA